MLISPAACHSLLSDLTTAESSAGPHTALLVLPNGQLLCVASALDEAGDGEDVDGAGAAGDPGDDVVDGLSQAINGVAVDDDEAAAGDEVEDEEPYLERDQRLRLLQGLALQWEPGVPPKQECELGRLYFYNVPLPEPEPVPPGAMLPVVRPNIPRAFILALNGDDGTPWSEFTARVDQFKARWRI